MFDLSPLSRPVAIIEMLVLLTVAACIGWFLARIILNNRINALRSAITDQESELDECRRSKVATPLGPTYLPPLESVRSVPANLVSEEVATQEVTVLESVMTDASLLLEPEHSVLEPIKFSPDPARPTASGNSEAAILQRIAARAGELNFNHIGLASAAEADDLKDIIGIGPFLERKLHSLGIYTFRQVANFAKEDIDKVNDIIEFFPGRIERDNWVDQAKLFHEHKYGKKIQEQS